MDPALFDSLRLELRRGNLVLAVLAQLRTEHYGYALRTALSDLGLDIDEGTLYPLLRRLETQELLTSEWREEGGRRQADPQAVAGRVEDHQPVAQLDSVGPIILYETLQELRQMFKARREALA